MLVNTDVFSGTSSAAPHVAGLAALILSVNPCLTREEVKYVIESTCTKIRPDLYVYGNDPNHPNGTWNIEVGYGLVNAGAAVALAQQMGGYTYIRDSIVTGTVIWTGNKMIHDSLVIDSLATLTVTDTIYMSSDARLIVRPGGKLIVDGRTLTSACPNELWLSYPTRTRSITDNVSHFTNCEFIVSKYCRDSSVDPNTCTCPELMPDTVLDLNELEQWHTAAQSANLANYANIGDPYSLAETRFMEGYAETFAGDAEDAEMANYAEFHALKLALRDNVAANDVAVGANDYSPLQKTTASLDMKSVPAGVYVLRVTGTDGNEYYQKIVKK